ncbi:MAG: hypothetical protein QXP81_09300 [Nitrososphaerota archaeon]
MKEQIIEARKELRGIIRALRPRPIVQYYIMQSRPLMVLRRRLTGKE